jgi:hypothetical protein
MPIVRTVTPQGDDRWKAGDDSVISLLKCLDRNFPLILCDFIRHIQTGYDTREIGWYFNRLGIPSDMYNYF